MALTASVHRYGEAQHDTMHIFPLGDPTTSVSVRVRGGDGGHGGDGGDGGCGAPGAPGRDATRHSCGTDGGPGGLFSFLLLSVLCFCIGLSPMIDWPID